MTDSHTIQGFNPASLLSSGFYLGCTDLIQGGSFKEAAGKMIFALLSMLRNQDGHLVIKGATVILPPAVVTEHTAESVLIALVHAAKELKGRELSEQGKTILRQLIRVVHSPSLEIADLIRTVQEQGPVGQHAIIVADANQYRDNTLVLSVKHGISAIRLSEDKWAPHVTSLCKQLVTIIKDQEGYGLIHVPYESAQTPTNKELLTSVDDCYVSVIGQEGDPLEKCNSRMLFWRSMALRGLLPEVETEIDTLSLPETTKQHLLIQLLQGTGRDLEILEYIDQLRPNLSELKSDASIQIAQMAFAIGHDDLALEILPATPEGIGDQLWLEEGLELSIQLKDNKRITLFDTYLAELFPHSERLRENRDRRLIINCQTEKSGEPFLFTNAGFTNFQLDLQVQLFTSNPAYDSIIEKSGAVGSDRRELATVCCAAHARSFDNPIYAAKAASHITTSQLYGRQATMVLLWSLKSMILKELISEGHRDIYKHLFQKVFQFLALHPEDEDIRRKLLTLLSVESCGDMGIPIVAATVLDFAQKGVQLTKSGISTSEKTLSSTKEEIEISIKNGLAWLDDLGAAEPGVTVLPRKLLIAEPDHFIQTLTKLVEMASGQDGEDADLEFMKKLVFLACSVSPHATRERNADISLTRHLASFLAMQGQFQQARNLAEAILLMGHHDAYRSRLAWQAFGDIYHRCRNHIIALIGLASALAINVEISKADCWHEVYTLHRILRDLGLLKHSRSLLPTMKALLTGLGYDADNDLRQLSAELTLRLIEADASDTAGINTLLSEIAEACHKATESRDRLHPFALLLGQAVLKAEKAGVEVSSEVQLTLNTALQQAGIGMAEIIRTASMAKPTATDVLKMFNGLERAMYASDIVHDRSVIELAARRLLDSSPQNERSLHENIFATELLADHTAELLGDESVMTQDLPVKYAEELNQEGLDVVFLALDTQGELVVTLVSNGQVSAVEQPKAEQSFRQRFQRWLQYYPKDYGQVDRNEGNNVFYTTMEQLDIRLPYSDRLILVAESFLQQLTANLALIQPEDGGFSYFAGTNTAIGCVPSLSWLLSARKARRSPRKGYKAWISAERNSRFGEVNKPVEAERSGQVQYQREPTLDIALSRLSGCFEEFGFIVNTDQRLPRDMHDASLVVVTAHGGLNTEGRYLHRISDDRDLVESPSALSAALSGVELVVLFVCSGGRIDKNPWGNSTTSLPKQLLNNGCRTVIASPWPLNVMVTYNWLEAFLHQWENGIAALDATKLANDSIARHFGEVPQYSLAMRVYGDVLLVKTEAKEK
ncbi:CHAT domain-containing protein [Serratia fonticola]|uniref:CHAT domain-containing protein n=1 Tax=Serratia fonticola TaxID=47917 RepID=UPI002177D6F4|nr:CHAT domain-containing protein [Serratia fonticola]CAI1932578.1 CHAT domain [Serratia fonticola]